MSSDMDCPKCGFSQPDGTTECRSCGILFARLQPRAPRPEHQAPPPAPEPRSNAHLFILIIGMFVFGLVWMAHRRKTANEPAVDLDAINHQQVQLQMAARAKRETEERNALRAQIAAASSLPQGLTKDSIIQAIESCPAFRNPTAATLRRVSTLGRFSKTDTAFTISIGWEQFATDNESRVLASSSAVAVFEGNNGSWRLKNVRDEAGGTLCE